MHLQVVFWLLLLLLSWGKWKGGWMLFSMAYNAHKYLGECFIKQVERGLKDYTWGSR
jgi:hypothetical protein